MGISVHYVLICTHMGFQCSYLSKCYIARENQKTTKQTKPLGTINLHTVSMSTSSRNTDMRKIYVSTS